MLSTIALLRGRAREARHHAERGDGARHRVADHVDQPHARRQPAQVLDAFPADRAVARRVLAGLLPDARGAEQPAVPVVGEGDAGIAERLVVGELLAAPRDAQLGAGDGLAAALIEQAQTLLAALVGVEHVEIVDLLDDRRPDRRMRLEVADDPGGPGLLGADAEEVHGLSAGIGGPPRAEPVARLAQAPDRGSRSDHAVTLQFRARLPSVSCDACTGPPLVPCSALS